jgi:serine phosphatase RsbU (regulator of sigma subunit)
MYLEIDEKVSAQTLEKTSKTELLTNYKPYSFRQDLAQHEQDRYNATISSLLANLSQEQHTVSTLMENNDTTLFQDPTFWIQFKERIIEEHASELIEQKRVIEQKNRLITESIEYAKTIQEAILTSHAYFTSVFADHFVYYQPKDIVSGDFYWAFKTKSNKIFWCTADCTGHGVPGAFMTMIGNSLLNEIIIENGEEVTNVILDKLRDSVIKTLNKSTNLNDREERVNNGMDIALCCWDLSTNELTFSGAHSSVLIVRNGELIQIKGDKQPIGLHRKMEPFQVTSFQLEKGDRIYTSSDGYTDQTNEIDGKRFSFTNFKKLLLKIAEQPMEVQKEEVSKIHNLWKGNSEQLDDIVVVGVLVS